MRRCKACDIEKPLDDFPPYTARGIIGRRGTCRVCWNAKWFPVIAAHGSRYYHENANGYRDKQKVRTARRHRSAGPALHRQQNDAYAARHPLKAAAKQAVMLAVRSGRLQPKPCQVCDEAKAQAHHDDYSKPLDVIWLCVRHHGERHRLLNRQTPADQWPAEWSADLRVQEFPK